MSASECQCSSDWAVSWNLVGSISSVWVWDGCRGCSCSAIVDIRGSQQCTVYRRCTTCALCGRCLSQFQICVCVSGLLRLLSVSTGKFSPRQPASTVTKSLSSPAGASCQSQQKSEQLRAHILNSHENPALKHNRYFNIATAQRPRETMQVFIRINEICSRDTRLCSRRIYVEFQTTYVEYLPSCR